MPKCSKNDKAIGLKETNLDVKYEYKDLCFLMSMIWRLLTISLNFPNAVNTLKEVWLLTETEMNSGATAAMTIPNYKYQNVNFSLCFY